MSKLIAFSGACNSGKTTTLNTVYDELKKQGKNVVILHELVRTKEIGSIDKLRSDANAYLDFQEKITLQRIEQEQEARNDKSDTIYLLDRAITDYLFYTENYIDKNQLDEKHTQKFYELCSLIRFYLTTNGSSTYNALLHFEPFEKLELDNYRPKNLELSQTYEACGIYRINMFYLQNSLKLMNIHLEGFIEYIINLINNTL